MQDQTISGFKKLELEFTINKIITEEHRPSQVFSVRFCDVSPPLSQYFATAGANCLSIYKICDDNSIDFVQGYRDEDIEEDLYSCTWCLIHGTPLVCVAGLRGIIKCFDISIFELHSILLGHGNAVNDLKTHPCDEKLIFSASKDESIRLWNTETSVCIAIFGGEKGHRDEVLCVDIHLIGNCFVSSGMDTSIKIWSLEEPSIQEHINKSYTNPRKSYGNLCFQPLTIQWPEFSTTQIHNNYVDSIKWVGNFILSKSTKNRAVLWMPDPDRYKGAALVLKEFHVEDSSLWFLRMDVCIPLDIVAIGNGSGSVFIYKISSFDGDGGGCTPSSKTKHQSIGNGHGEVIHNPDITLEPVNANAKASSEDKRPGSTVREVCFHVYGNYVAYCYDNGTVVVWSINSNLII